MAGKSIGRAPSAWRKCRTRRRHPGGAALEMRAPLETLPHFGRVGYLLPLGPEIDRADAMNVGAPLDEAWLFGPQKSERSGFAQLRYASRDGQLQVACSGGRTRAF